MSQIITCCHCKGQGRTQFEDYYALQKHFTKFHSHETDFTCSLCSHSYVGLSSFRTHWNRKHKLVNNPRTVDIEVARSDSDSDLIADPDPVECNIDVDLNPESCIVPNTSSCGRSVDDNTYVVQFLSKLHSYAQIPRSLIENIVNDIDTFIADHIDRLIDRAEEVNSLKTTLLNNRHPFEKFKTLHLQLKEFKNRGTYVEPIQIKIGEREEYRKKNNELVRVKVDTSFEFIPIRHIFRLFFQLPDVLEYTLAYMEFLKNDENLITNIIQTDFWKQLINDDCEKDSKIFLPLFFYFDDYETNNPLGTHAGVAKCGGVYLSIPCLPPQMRSKVDNIFFFAIFNTLDRKVMRNEMVFREIISELTFLDVEGVLVRNGNSEVKLCFRLVNILGDNLGLHEILGFTPSFNATHFCRYCWTLRMDISNVYCEDDVILRTEENYAQDIENLTHGVTEECVFNRLKSYHVMRNKSIDVAHDILEGVAQYDLAKIFSYFIYKKKYFTLNQLNDRILGYPYQNHENKPPIFKDSHIKIKLKCSCSEMMTLIRNFTFLFGDLVPENDVCWELFLSFKVMYDEIMSKSVSECSHKILKILVKEYLSMLNEIFPNSLKPKHHFLVHYPSILKLMGPLSNMSTMRFESKHRQGKQISKNSTCRINVCRTIAIKTQLKLNYRFLCPEPISNICNYKNSGEKIKIADLAYAFDFLESDTLNLLEIDEFIKLEWISLFDKRMYVNNIIIDYAQPVNPSLYAINMFLLERNRILILAQEIQDNNYDRHFQCFTLGNCVSKFRIFTEDDLASHTVVPEYEGKVRMFNV